METAVDIRNLTRSKTPVLPFEKVASHILPGWNISLAFVGETRAQCLNMALRGKTYTPNVLSYAVGKKSGEIIICPSVARKQAPDYQLSTINYQLFLFIHALLHLKGGRHGATMEATERELLSRFVPLKKNNASKNRHRN